MYTTLIVIACVFGWILLGYFLGELSWRVWHKKESGGFLAFFFFPINSFMRNVGNRNNRSITFSLIDKFKNGGNYVTLMIVAWFFKLLWNVVCWLIVMFLWVSDKLIFRKS